MGLMSHEAVAKKLGVVLPEDIASFFKAHAADEEPVGKEWGEFDELVEPEELLENGFSVLCPPDFMLLLGNGAGDYLVAQLDWDGYAEPLVVP